MISAWRITNQKHVKTAFTGEDARLFGGRWNSPGQLVVYAAESRARALNEIPVHLESAAVLSRYVAFKVDIDESLSSARSAVLRVRSAIVGGEFNYLLNPLHPEFPKLRIDSPEKFQIDKRLVR